MCVVYVRLASCLLCVQLFHRVSPSWIPQYTMVAFTRIPYDQVVRRARRQDRILKNVAMGVAGAAAVAVAAGAVALLRNYYPHTLPQISYAVRWPRLLGGGVTTNAHVISMPKSVPRPNPAPVSGVPLSDAISAAAARA